MPLKCRPVRRFLPRGSVPIVGHTDEAHSRWVYPGSFVRMARDTTRASAVKGFVFPTRLLDEAGPLWGKEFDIVVV